MKILALILLALSYSAFSREDNHNKQAFEAWLTQQYGLLEDPIALICSQVCSHQYVQCLRKQHQGRWWSRVENSEECTELETACINACLTSSTPVPPVEPPPTDPGDSTPPDTDPGNDETNTPPPDGQPPIL